MVHSSEYEIRLGVIDACQLISYNLCCLRSGSYTVLCAVSIDNCGIAYQALNTFQQLLQWSKHECEGPEYLG